MTKHAYILTKEGREYSDEGIALIMSVLRNRVGETADITLCQGALYNDPKFLEKELLSHPNAYVFISSSKGIDLICNENIGVLIQNLRKNPKVSSWMSAIAPYEYENP